MLPKQGRMLPGAELSTEGWGRGALRSDPASVGQEKGQVVSAELVAGQEVWGREGVLLGIALTVS